MVPHFYPPPCSAFLVSHIPFYFLKLLLVGWLRYGVVVSSNTQVCEHRCTPTRELIGQSSCNHAVLPGFKHEMNRDYGLAMRQWLSTLMPLSH